MINILKAETMCSHLEKWGRECAYRSICVGNYEQINLQNNKEKWGKECAYSPKQCKRVSKTVKMLYVFIYQNSNEWERLTSILIQSINFS